YEEQSCEKADSSEKADLSEKVDKGAGKVDSSAKTDLSEHAGDEENGDAFEEAGSSEKTELSENASDALLKADSSEKADLSGSEKVVSTEEADSSEKDDLELSEKADRPSEKADSSEKAESLGTVHSAATGDSFEKAGSSDSGVSKAMLHAREEIGIRWLGLAEFCAARRFQSRAAEAEAERCAEAGHVAECAEASSEAWRVAVPRHAEVGPGVSAGQR
ncbi:unnamed protein product, partial [Prorocentrum cordatum]